MRRFRCRITGILVALASAWGAACSPHAAAPPPLSPPAAATSFQSEDLKVGSGPAITAGREAVVQYTGWLYEASAADHKGREFDSSRRTGQPFRFALGAGQVIKGWDRGVAGMQVGGTRRLIIPPELGYGDAGADDVIPPGATLVFDVELIGIQ
ncbi:MAG TPA: FKBP-type peptidyl-prolyl cis-trans isomerase [Steroidobacteraceae bacterium]|nr:FKBP-type peptidyl-prolyl cis-trans isomerase [Steroidobacteraceae bacterium]